MNKIKSSDLFRDKNVKFLFSIKSFLKHFPPGPPGVKLNINGKLSSEEKTLLFGT